jgi:hypothetical protein
MTTNVPAVQFTPTGVVVPAASDVLAGVQVDNNTAFGGNLNPSLSTPQGQLASTLTAIIADKNAQIANIANQVDPAFAAGRWQDALGRIYFLTRVVAAGTVVQATCLGLAGVVIPVGSLAKDTSGNIYSCTQAGTIPVGGSIVLAFTCTTVGPIACPIGALNAIYQAIPGWDSINNLAAGVVGNLVESRTAFELRRKASVALNAQGSLASIYGAVLNVAGVIDAYVYENDTNAAITAGATNYSLAANSLYVAVVGGLAQDIANAIWLKKSPGCNTNGNTSVTVIDNSGYSYPYPTYTIKFNAPTALPILFAVQIQNNPNLPANIVALVQNAIIAAFNGTDGGSRARIGSTIVAGRFYADVAATSPYTSVLSILLGTATATLTSVVVGIDQTPTITATNITVTLV